LKFLIFIGLYAFAIGNCFALEELEALTELAPMPGPDKRNLGWEWHFIDQHGKPGNMRKIHGTKTMASYTRSDGCRWTRPVLGFAPASVWANCPSSGKAKVEFAGGDIWPLKVGNHFTYKTSGTSSLFGTSWNNKRDCKVKYSVKIRTVSGEHDTFKVVCEERWGTRTWWLSPKVGTAVAYQQKTFRGGLVLQEMTKIIHR